MSVDDVAGPRSLDELVIDVATSLMTVGAASLVEICELVLQRLVTHLGVDTGFVRRNDHALGATVLVAEWPRRADVPDPDPLGVVRFADADPVFAALETLSEVMVARPDADDPGYQDRVRDGSGIDVVSTVVVPMRRDGLTTGVFGLVVFGDRGWTPAEIGSLNALGGLLAQALYRVQAEERLQYLAYHDELTGLVNRRALLDRLQHRLDADRDRPVAVLLIGVDRLKAIDDFLGLAAGDEFLRQLAGRVGAAVGTHDVVARFPGDELVVLVDPGRAVDEAAAALAEGLQRTLGETVRIGHTALSRSVSIGVAVSRPGVTATDLVAEADQAVVAAKAAGGNRTVAVTDAMRADHGERTEVELHLRDAIAAGELVLHYQPQVDLVTGDLIGTEALVRWRHPHRGLLSPDAFVRVAELTGLSGELGRWVLDTACAQLATWQTEFDVPDFRMGVNATPAQLVTVDLVDIVAATLRTNAVAARNLVLEITETTAVSDLPQTRRTLAGLRDLGVRLALDDFGTGYSSFAQLKELPVDVLKIDRGFITDIAHSRADAAIVRAVVDLARSFGLDTLAEGVETAEAAEALVAIGCRHAQGYLISRPLPAGDMRTFLQRDQVRRSG